MARNSATSRPGCGVAALVEVNASWNDSAGRRAPTWFRAGDVVAQMLTSPASPDLVDQALGETFDLVHLAGAPGWCSSTDPRRAVMRSPDGDNVVVIGITDPKVDPLELARSVTVVDSATDQSSTVDGLPEGVRDGCDASLFCSRPGHIRLPDSGGRLHRRWCCGLVEVDAAVVSGVRRQGRPAMIRLGI